MSTYNPSITLSKGAASATLIGVIAMFLWACLALLTTLTAGIPAFQLLASSFAVALVVSLCMLGLRGSAVGASPGLCGQRVLPGSSSITRCISLP